MAQQSHEIGVRVCADGPGHVRRDEPGEHWLVEEHLPRHPFAVAALTPARLKDVSAALEAGRVGWDGDWCGGNLEGLAEAVFAHAIDHDQQDDDERRDRHGRPFEETLHVRGSRMCVMRAGRFARVWNYRMNGRRMAILSPGDGGRDGGC